MMRFFAMIRDALRAIADLFLLLVDHDEWDRSH